MKDRFNRISLFKIFALLLGACIFMAAHGCTKQAWFEGLKNRERQECSKYPSESDVRKCLEQVDAASIDEGRKEK